MIPIPIGLRFEVSANGTAIKRVDCEKCALEFIYVVNRSIVASESSFLAFHTDKVKTLAQEKAAEALARALERAIDPVGCPECAWYQMPMVRAARRHRAATAAVAIVMVSVFAGLAHLFGAKWPLPEVIAGSIALLLVGFILHALNQWSPNSDVGWRERNRPKEEGRAMRKDEYDRVAAEALSHPASAPAAAPLRPSSKERRGR